MTIYYFWRVIDFQIETDMEYLFQVACQRYPQCHREQLPSSQLAVRSLKVWFNFCHSGAAPTLWAFSTALACFSSSLLSGRSSKTSIVLVKHIRNRSPVASSQATLYFFLYIALQAHSMWIYFRYCQRNRWLTCLLHQRWSNAVLDRWNSCPFHCCNSNDTFFLSEK